MSKKEKKDSPKKNHWVLKFLAFTLVLLVVAILGGKASSTLPNIIGVIYVVAGIAWFYKNTKPVKEASR
ncbi:MAG: hypothetical protein RR561_08390 [Peptostreptococcus sp.]|uniref:hypothetical protein n=1 Tax=Peptostreptococcus sp. TaxID=1262 RepID=UPI002FCBB45A